MSAEEVYTTALQKDWLLQQQEKNSLDHIRKRVTDTDDDYT